MLQKTPLALKAALLLSCLITGTANADLVHPGGWHTQSDLTLIRSKVAEKEEPWITGWEAAQNEGPDADFSTNPPELVTSNSEMHTAGFAAWVLTMKWVASGDKSYSDAAIRIIDTWVETVRDFDVFGPTLTISTGAGAMAQAAEILEHGFDGEAGWNQENADDAKDWFRSAIYDPWTNTGIQSSSNWGTSALGGNMSMAIFMDDEIEYEYQLDAFINGYPNTDDGCNSVTDYIIFPSGQALETGRDQAHVQGGIAHLTEAALIMWHQGDELVYHENNRLLAGVEYHARYNLGYTDLPFDQNIPAICGDSRRSNDPEISEEDRGDFSPVYYLSARLFSKAGLDHPNTKEVLAAPGYSPEENNFAHPGLGTFTFVSTDEVIVDLEDELGEADNGGSTTTDDGASIDRSNWTVVASNNASIANLAIDGNSGSRWDTSQQQSAGQWFEIDMRSTQLFDKVVLDTSASPNDYPRGYKLEVSDNGINWNTVGIGTGRSAETTISFSAQNARYIRIEQTGFADGTWWSIHEVEVFAAENNETNDLSSGGGQFSPMAHILALFALVPLRLRRRMIQSHYKERVISSRIEMSCNKKQTEQRTAF